MNSTPTRVVFGALAVLLLGFGLVLVLSVRAEDAASYPSVQELAADLNDGGYRCRLGRIQQGGTSEGAECADTAGGERVTLTVFATSQNLDGELSAPRGSPRLVGANWLIEVWGVPSDEIESALQEIRGIVGGEYTTR